MFYEQLKIDKIFNFFPQNDLYLKNRKYAKTWTRPFTAILTT